MAFDNSRNIATVRALCSEGEVITRSPGDSEEFHRVLGGGVTRCGILNGVGQSDVSFKALAKDTASQLQFFVPNVIRDLSEFI